MEEILHDIGLSKNESKIYLALLELGPTLMGELCGKTKIHRRNVYDSIEMLKEKGFVSSTIINNRNVFEATTPRRILDILEEKKKNVENILPVLLAKQSNKKSTVKVYTGLQGRKIIFEDKLKYYEEQYVLGAHPPSKKTSAYLENYHERRIEKGIKLKILYVSRTEVPERKLIESRVLPKKFASPIAINLYGDKTAIFLGSDTIEPLAILIENQELTDDFKQYFQILWNISR